MIGFVTGIAKLSLNLPLLKGASIVGIFWGESVERDPAGHRLAVDELLALHERGLIRPHIHDRWPLERGREALAFLSSRQTVGKLVVTI